MNLLSLSQPSRQQSGFSTTELLIAIGLAAVLMALFFPGLSSAREGSNAAVCQTNLRKLLVAWNQYAVDHNGTICPVEEPINNPDGNGQVAWIPWLANLAPYIPGEIIIRGWGDSGGTGSPAWSWIEGGKAGGDRVYGRQSIVDCPSNLKYIHYVSNPDYGYNILAFGNHQTHLFTSFRKMAAIPQPSQQLVFMDSKFAPGDTLYSDKLLPDNQVTWAAPHRGRTHIGFADGHVESWELTRLQEVSQGLARYQKAPWFAN